MSRIAMILGVACVTMGCPQAAPKRVELYPMTGAPPARTIEVLNKDDRHAIAVSSGVAFGVIVSDGCQSSTPPTIEIADTKVLREHPLARPGSQRAFVLVAGAAGTTTLTIKAECATQSYQVTVTPQSS